MSTVKSCKKPRKSSPVKDKNNNNAAQRSTKTTADSREVIFINDEKPKKSATQVVGFPAQDVRLKDPAFRGRVNTVTSTMKPGAPEKGKDSDGSSSGYEERNDVRSGSRKRRVYREGNEKFKVNCSFYVIFLFFF